jgi:hypothetical protein
MAHPSKDHQGMVPNGQIAMFVSLVELGLPPPILYLFA